MVESDQFEVVYAPGHTDQVEVVSGPEKVTITAGEGRSRLVLTVDRGWWEGACEKYGKGGTVKKAIRRNV